MTPTTNLNPSDLEDAIVERLKTNSFFENRAFGADAPLVEIEEFVVLPLVFVTCSSERQSAEPSNIGRPLTRKTEPVVEISIFASSMRGPKGSKAIHPIGALVKDLLMGWQPDLEEIIRPLVYEDGNQFNQDVDAQIISWLQTWSTMTITREVLNG